MARRHEFEGLWYIYDMEMWDDDYFNMECQAYINIQSNKQGDFQFGLVIGSLDGYVEDMGTNTRFSFSWEGEDEMDAVNGSGWIQLADGDATEIEGLIDILQGDRSRFKAKRAEAQP